MKKIGITGQNGFVGQHLYNTIGLTPNEFERIEFKKDFFDEPTQLDLFVQNCDVIVHLAAMNRHEIYIRNKHRISKTISSFARKNKVYSARFIFVVSTRRKR